MSKKQFKVAITFTLTEDVIVDCLENEDPEAMAKLQILNGEIPLRSHKCRDLKTLCIDGPIGDKRCVSYEQPSDFSWALKQMKDGHDVKRKTWNRTKLSCCNEKGDMQYLLKSREGKYIGTYYEIDWEDIISNDWELCENE